MVRFKLVSCKRFNNSTGLKIPWLANGIDLATHSSKNNDIDKCKILEKRTRGRRYSSSNTKKDDDIDSCKILEKTGERLALPVVRRRGGGASRVKITEIFSFPLHALFLSHPAKTCQFRLNQRPDLTLYAQHVLFTFIGGHPQQFYVEGRVALKNEWIFRKVTREAESKAVWNFFENSSAFVWPLVP